MSSPRLRCFVLLVAFSAGFCYPNEQGLARLAVAEVATGLLLAKVSEAA